MFWKFELQPQSAIDTILAKEVSTLMFSCTMMLNGSVCLDCLCATSRRYFISLLHTIFHHLAQSVCNSFRIAH